MYNSAVIIILLSSSFLYCCRAKRECVAVTGHFKCQSPALVYAKLVDNDGVTSDAMAEMCPVTVSTGSFDLRGCASDVVGRIDPEIHIYHKCKGSDTRQIKLIVPQSALDGSNATAYNFEQVIDLDGFRMKNERAVSKFPKLSDKCRKG
uniref:Uncharacterized protein n=1 Tax=Romanomermis culicivorax TaxID=13658 RepID=A0A915IH97_ROMCU